MSLRSDLSGVVNNDLLFEFTLTGNGVRWTWTATR